EGAQWKVVRAARWASSANHVYGRNITSSETWTWLHSPVFRATPLDMKAEADIHFLQGINQLIGHGWAYTPPHVEYPGWRFYAAGIYDEKNPWWIVMPDLTAYLQRMSWLMRQGTPQNDIALYLPNADAYAHFTAGKVHLIDVERELIGDKIMPAIFEAGYNLDFFDDEILKTTGKVERNELLLGPNRHSIVILPGIERMPLESLKKLDDFVKAGGILVATRRLPAIVPGLKTSEAEHAEFTSIVQKLFGSSNPSVRFVENEDGLGAVLATLAAPDAQISPFAKDFGFVHRGTDDADIYFVVNTGNQKQNVEITFRTSAPGIEIWDAMNGSLAAADIQKRTAASTTLALEFEPYQSKVIVFSKQGSSAKLLLPGSTIASNIDLSGEWKVSFDSTGPTSMTSLHSWADDSSSRYFSGVATYERSFDIPTGISVKRSILDFGAGTALNPLPTRNGMQTWFDPPIREAAVIYVNRQRAGSLWCPPYKLDIAAFLRNGRNEIKIEVGNTALNYMAGHSLPDYKLLTLRYGERFQAQDMDKIEPLRSGILTAPSLHLFR
ncbi:MAG: glycosyl hydrolase, partial [Acidobacteriota bacterium]